MILVKETRVETEFILIKNVLLRKLTTINRNDIISITESDWPVGGIMTHHLSISTKHQNYVIYPDLIKNYQDLKQLLER